MMTFIGHDLATVDTKRRLTVAAKFRRVLDADAKEKFVVTLGSEGCIAVYPLSAWRPVAEKLASMDDANPTARALRRKASFHATEVELDGQCRLLLPAELAERANVSDATGALVIANGPYLEIWNPETYEKYDKALEADGLTFDALKQKMSNGG